MNTMGVTFIDPQGRKIATVQVAPGGDGFAGVIDLSSMPAELRGKFERYEEIVSGQMFSLLDAIEAEIESLGLRAVFDEGCPARVGDLQVLPSTRRASFKIVKEPAEGAAIS